MVGSRHEGYGETGMAHLLEHMLFKGTAQAQRDLAKLIADATVAATTASTYYDRTNYFETMHATDENLQLGARNGSRPHDQFARLPRRISISEMTVVRNEFEMGENSPPVS